MNYSSTNMDTRAVCLINLINFLNKTISQYGLGIIYLLGNIGSALTCLVFYQPTFRHSSCAMYFLASNFSQFFTFNFALLTRMLFYGYDVRIANTFGWFCKVRYYLFYIFIANSRYNIIMASIDRYFASSQSVLSRQYSSPRIASRVILIGAITWCLIYIQVLVFYDIYDGSCQYQTGTYGIFFSIFISIDSGVLPIVVMLIFGSLTIRNVHRSRRRIGVFPSVRGYTQTSHGNRLTRRDMQLYRMLINQIILFTILNIPNPCYLIYNSFTIEDVEQPVRQTVTVFVSNMTYVLIYFGFALTFVNFAISSKIFRREFQRLIQRKVHCLRARHMRRG
ncbi:unnamed protein product [Adineta ricciae]|uniref:G-protein coupled receptors family 1 profile domain-containing protein n=1 Tax=Adineta ricciae TaxID=249248 RepID=A0A816AVV2_ADIRI|nr:unnamed protein product [Adineta ricciae]CAF1602455.1 unnamed protein product [Adineta ricciae]